MEENKTCRITNGQFSWIMEVDNNTISFNGRWNAEYFAKHYKDLGYDVYWYEQE